ncbi:hypothetical protein GFM13_00905 [Rhizobium leguminosarum bv. viciae]|nr:hypothetical protein [Rhizobium leguminosarum bv. viciae]
MKEIKRRDKSTNSIDAMENKKCLLIRLRPPPFSVAVRHSCNEVAWEAIKFLPRTGAPDLVLTTGTSYVTDVRCVTAPVAERTPMRGRAATLPDP